MKIRLKKINFIDCKFLIACITFLLISSNVIAQEWIEITTPADKLKYQISPGTLATVKFSGDFYILIDGRYVEENKISSGLKGSSNQNVFYFSDKVYLGIEMGFGFLRDGRGINLVKYKNPDDPTLVDTKTKGNSTNLNWGPNYQGTIRIGYCIK